jgi:hypothetical protein
MEALKAAILAPLCVHLENKSSVNFKIFITKSKEQKFK